MNGNTYYRAHFFKRFAQAAGLFAALLFSARTLADTGNGSYVFDGSVTNPAGSTPNITVTLEWRNAAGAIVSSTPIVVPLTPGDGDDDVRDKVVTALKANAAVAAAFTITDTSSFGYQVAKLEPKPGNFACSATILNGNKTGTPPTLVNTVTGLTTMGAGVDPSLGNVLFDIEGSPTGGSVSLAVNGVVAAVTSDGMSVTAIEETLATGLSSAGLKAAIDKSGRIVVTNVTVDALYQLGLRGEGGLEGMAGGASFYVTDSGIGATGIATQRCPAPIPIKPPETPEFKSLYILIVLFAVGLTALWLFPLRAKAKEAAR